MTDPLTDESWFQREEREKACKAVAEENPDVAKWLQQLLDREAILVEKGNAYGEVYSPRQMALALGPIFQREYIRSRILKTTRQSAQRYRRSQTD